MYWAIIFVTHQVGICIFRCTAVITRNIVLANGVGMLMLLCTILLDGFVIIKRYIHPWVVWYAAPPLTSCCFIGFSIFKSWSCMHVDAAEGMSIHMQQKG